MAVEERDDAGEPQKKGGGSKIIIIIAVIFVFMIILLVGGLIAYEKVLAPSLGLNPLFGEKKAANSEGSTEVEKPKNKQGIGGIYPLPSFIVNLADQGGNRFIKVTIQFEMSHKELAEELKSKLPKVQDQIITVLSSKKMFDVVTAEGKFRLKAEIMSRVNQFLNTGSVSNIYYTEFVVQ